MISLNLDKRKLSSTCPESTKSFLQLTIVKQVKAFSNVILESLISVNGKVNAISYCKLNPAKNFLSDQITQDSKEFSSLYKYCASII